MPLVTIKSGPSFECATGRTVLEGALAAGIKLPYDCGAGGCGHCKCKLVAGSVDMDGFEDRALSEMEADAGIILACRAVVTQDVTIELRGKVSVPIKQLTATVVGIEAPIDSVRRLKLEVPQMALVFDAGQYAKLSFGDIPARPYSMANRPDEMPLEFHIRQVPNGRASSYVAQGLKPGDQVKLEGPFGIATLRDGEKSPILAVATGTGLAPVLSLVRTALTMDATRRVFLYVGARDESELYAQAELEALTSHPGVSVNLVFSRAPAPTRHRAGYVQDAIKADGLPSNDLMVYVAGSPPMVDATRSVVTALGLSVERIYADPFLPAKRPPAPAVGLLKRLFGKR